MASELTKRRMLVLLCRFAECYFTVKEMYSVVHIMLFLSYFAGFIS